MTSGFPRSSISCSDSESSSNEFPTIRRNQSIQEFEAIGECEDIVNQEKEKEKEVERPIEIEFKELKEEDLNQILNQEKLKNQTLLSIKQSLNQVLNQIDLNYLNRSNLLEEHQRRIHHERLQCQFRSNEISGQNLLLDEFKKLRKIEVLDFKEELKKVENELMSQESDYLKERFKILQESNYLNQTINKLKNEISLRKSMIKRFKEQKLIHVQNEVIEEINKLKSSNQSKQNQLYTLKDQLQLQKSTKTSLKKSIHQSNLTQLNITSTSNPNHLQILIPNQIKSLIKINQDLIDYLKTLLIKIIYLPNFENLLNQDFHLKNHLNGFPCYLFNNLHQTSTSSTFLLSKSLYLNSKLQLFNFFIKNFKNFKKSFLV